MRGARTAVFIHAVWSTWDRLPLLEGELRRLAGRAIRAKCSELRAEVLALGGVADHVHLLVQLPAPLAVADLVKHVKGASSHLVNTHPDSNRAFRWQGSYAAFSVSPRDLARVAEYIDHQREHHTIGTFIEGWEQPLDEIATPPGHARG